MIHGIFIVRLRGLGMVFVGDLLLIGPVQWSKELLHRAATSTHENYLKSSTDDNEHQFHLPDQKGHSL